MFQFFFDTKLITTSQPGFKPGDYCINQMLSITHEIYKSLDDGLEVKGLSLLRNFLSNRKQQIVLNGQESTCTSVNAGDLQKSISSIIIK